MSHFIQETLPLLLFGLAGVFLMVFVKINDLNHLPENDLLTWRQTVSKFFRKEWASYGVSITIVCITSFSHEEWILWFKDGGKLASIVDVPLGAKLAMSLFGAVGHYLLYKFWLGKLDKK
jgi:hypothetical protein